MKHRKKIGREIISEEVASAHYVIRRVKHRLSGETSWEVLDLDSGITVIAGLTDRAEAMTAVKSWEAINRKRAAPLKGHRRVH